jgi:hypothetical protein
MSTDHEPTPAEASRALDMVRDQRIRLLTGEVAPRWLLILAVAVGSIGRRLGFRARLDPNDRERFLLVGLVFVLLLPGAIAAYDVLPMFDLPLPHTCSAAVFVVYACAIVPLHRHLLRLLERRRAR